MKVGLGVSGSKLSVTLFAQLCKAVILLATLAALGRLLEPADFGIVALAFALVGVGELLRDFGLSTAAIRARTLSVAQRDRLFWINAIVGLLLALMCLALAYPLAQVFGIPELSGAVIGLAPVFFLNALSTQYLADLARSMRFAALALTDVGASFLGLVVSVALALGGWGYWSIIAGQWCVAAMLLLTRSALSGWLPRRPVSGTSVREEVRFGVDLGLAQTLGFAAIQAPVLLTASLFGTAAAGFYNRAYQICSIPVNQILGPVTNLVISTLSRLSDTADRNARYFRIALLASVLLGFGFGLLALGADIVTLALLGPGWGEAARILSILAIGGIGQALTFPMYWYLLVAGDSRRLLHYNLVSKVFVVCSSSIGAFFGPEGVALGFAMGTLVSWPICLLFLRHAGGYVVWRHVKICCWALLAATGGGVAAGMAQSAYTQQPAWFVLVAMTGFAAAIAATAAALAWLLKFSLDHRYQRMAKVRVPPRKD